MKFFVDFFALKCYSRGRRHYFPPEQPKTKGNTEAVKPQDNISVSYDGLWKLLTQRKLKKKDLRELTHLSPAVIAKMGKGESVHLNTLVKICDALKCNIGDVVNIHTGTAAPQAEEPNQ